MLDIAGIAASAGAVGLDCRQSAGLNDDCVRRRCSKWQYIIRHTDLQCPPQHCRHCGCFIRTGWLPAESIPPSLKNGEAAHTSSSAYNDQGGTVTPSQIRFRKPRQRRSLRNEADCASCLTAPRSHFQPRLLPSKFTPMTGDSVGRRLDSLDSDSAVVIEVGQTLFSRAPILVYWWLFADTQ